MLYAFLIQNYYYYLFKCTEEWVKIRMFKWRHHPAVKINNWDLSFMNSSLQHYSFQVFPQLHSFCLLHENTSSWEVWTAPFVPEVKPSGVLYPQWKPSACRCLFSLVACQTLIIGCFTLSVKFHAWEVLLPWVSTSLTFNLERERTALRAGDGGMLDEWKRDKRGQ